MTMRVIVNNERVAIRAAGAADAAALHALIAANREEGHLLPRALDELTVHAPRFLVATRRGRIIGCAELAPLSAGVAEVRSLAVDRSARGAGLGLKLVDELGRRARLDGYSRLCAFAHDPGFFVRLGFSIVPHTWVPEKIAHDCRTCPLFRSCGQYALVLELRRAGARPGTAPRERPAARPRRSARPAAAVEPQHVR
jgi:N-acetylglutamate synthase-like GNAT family acetyltransferase